MRPPESAGLDGPNRRLHEASRSGNVEAAREALAAGADAQYTDDLHRTALHNAARVGQARVAQVLLAAGADVNVETNEGETPLHCASVAYCHGDVGRVLLFKRDKASRYGKPRLPELGRKGRREVVKLLLAGNADVDHRNVIGRTPLHLAAFSGNWEVAQLLLKNGAAPEAKDNVGNAPLHAAAYGHTDVGDLLAARGIGKDGQGSTAATPAHCGMASHCHPSRAQPLLAARTRQSPEALAYKGRLEKASEKARVKVAELLLAAGVDLHAKGQGGRTALHYAALEGHLEMIRLLMAKGADVHAKDDAGRTPWNLAMDAGHPEAAAMLLPRRPRRVCRKRRRSKKHRGRRRGLLLTGAKAAVR